MPAGNGASASRARQPQAWREAKAKRWPTSFTDPSMSTKRDVSRVPADHQAPSQEAVTTLAVKRNLGGPAAKRPTAKPHDRGNGAGEWRAQHVLRARQPLVWLSRERSRSHDPSDDVSLGSACARWTVIRAVLAPGGCSASEHGLTEDVEFAPTRTPQPQEYSHHPREKHRKSIANGR